MKDLLYAKEAALSWLKPATREILSRFQTDLTVHHKEDQSPVTLADQKAEEILRKKIQREFPDHGIIGEEFGEEDSHREWVWTVDPIDGTRSFIQGLPLFEPGQRGFSSNPPESDPRVNTPSGIRIIFRASSPTMVS